MRRSLAIVALLALSPFLGLTAHSDSPTASDRAAIEQSSTDRSVSMKAIRPYLRNAMLARARKDWPAELASYGLAIAVAPKVPAGYLCRGQAFLERREFEQAINDFAKVIELADPTDPSGYVMSAEVWIAKRDYVRAIAAYDKAIAAADDQWIGYAGRGEVLLQVGEYDRAITDLTKSIALAYGPDAPSQQLGDLLSVGCPRSPLILKVGDRLFGADNSSGMIWGNPFAYRGAAWFYKGEYDRALADFDQSTEISGYSPVGNAYRGLARLALGKCSMGFNDLKLAAHFAAVPFDQLMKNARPFTANTSCNSTVP